MIKINEFIKQYKECIADVINKKSEEKFIEKHVFKDKYINFEEKCSICNRILNASHFVKTKIEDKEHKIFVANSPSMYMLYKLELINQYTDIEIEFNEGKALESYNALDSLNLIDVIISMIPKTETDKMQEILDMKLDDLYENEHNIIGYIDRKLSALGNLFGALDVVMSNEKMRDKIVNKVNQIVN